MGKLIKRALPVRTWTLPSTNGIFSYVKKTKALLIQISIGDFIGNCEKTQEQIKLKSLFKFKNP